MNPRHHPCSDCGTPIKLHSSRCQPCHFANLHKPVEIVSVEKVEAVNAAMVLACEEWRRRHKPVAL